MIVTAGLSLQANATVDVSGYFDMEYISTKGSQPYYRQHHVNLMMQHSFENYKFFSEIEFEDAVDFNYGRTPVKNDAAKTKTGRLFIERAWGEMSVNELVNFRVGQMLHTSLYLTNHYPSLTVNFTDPSTRKAIFDYNVKGVSVWGESNGFYYDVWNGKGPQVADDTAAIQDHERANDTGGKIAYTMKLDNGSVTAGILLAEYANKANIGADHSTGFEVMANVGKFTLWSEYGTRKSGLISTNDVTAGYAIASYSFDLAKGEILPFLMYDTYKISGLTESNNRIAAGATYRPYPNISYKAEYITGNYYDSKAYATIINFKNEGYL